MQDDRFVTFLSDYGQAEEFVGVCHAVIARRCPQARVIDLTHAIPRHDVRTGALVLRDCMPYVPAGVHLAVVDPAVGATGERARRAVALRAGDGQSLFVGPDNGLLTLAAERAGGVVEAVELSRSPELLQPVSRTFHGRDVFAPVAGALAAGEALGALGDALEPGDLRRIELPRARVQGDAVRAHVLRVDHFGNLILDVSREQLAAVGISPGCAVLLQAGPESHGARYGATFADVPGGELLLYEDAQRTLALAVNRGSAADRLDAGVDTELVVRTA